MHEKLIPILHARRSSDRSFGFVMAIFFLIVALTPVFVRPGGELTTWALALAGLFFMLALFNARALKQLNWLWAQFGTALSFITSPIAIGLLFYLGIAPFGFIFRILGKDPLRLRLEPTIASYWILRESPTPSSASMKNQF